MVRKRTAQKEKENQVPKQESQTTLKTEKSAVSIISCENDAISAILEHAMEFNNKKTVNDLNMLDVLNSYDELISNPSFLLKLSENFSLSNE